MSTAITPTDPPYDEVDTQQRISFKVGDEMFIMPINVVQEVMEYQVPVPVPGAPDAVEGVLNVRGDIVTALSGHQLLDQTSTSPKENWRQIIMHSPEGLVALSVDQVGEIVTFSANEAQWNTQQSDCELFEGTLKQGQNLFILLNFDQFKRQTYDQHHDHANA